MPRAMLKHAILACYISTKHTYDRRGCQEQFVPMMSFATNLRRRAAVLGLSSAEVARRAGLTERRYGNYVTGRREPDLATLVRIADVLQTSVDVLLANGSVEASQSSVEALREKLAVAAVSLNESDLEVLVVQAEALTSRRHRD